METVTADVRADPASSGRRVDRFLADALPALSRARIQALIASGEILLGDAPLLDPARKVRPDDVFRIRIPPAAPPAPLAQAIALGVVFEDDDLVVVDKPAGLVVHPAPGNPDMTLVNALLAHCGEGLSGIGGVRRPGIVHRIDKDTTGLIVAAKNDLAHAGLSAQFARHSIERAYRAVVWGLPSPLSGEIEGAIGRDPRDRKRMAVVPAGGKPALTRYRVLRAFGTVAALVECRLETGRTHQVRVHMASRSHPLVGDPVYGRPTPARRRAAPAAAAFPRQALHAAVLGFRHPRSGAPMRFEAPDPKDFKLLMGNLERLETEPPRPIF